jgi:hypothetical protein
MLNKVKIQLENNFNQQLINLLFDSFIIAKEHFYLGKYRPACLEGARFAEIVLRMLQEKMEGNYTPLNNQINRFKDIALSFEQKNSIQFNESLRITIPHTLIIIYDIRNKRNIGHINGDINENYIDATLSMNACSWILAELFRIFNISSNIEEGNKIVNSIVKLKIPLIQDFNGFLKILKPSLGLTEKILSLLYYRGEEGCKEEELSIWIKKVRPTNLRRALNNLEDNYAFIHKDGMKYILTNTGRTHVENNIPLSID